MSFASLRHTCTHKEGERAYLLYSKEEVLVYLVILLLQLKGNKMYPWQLK